MSEKPKGALPAHRICPLCGGDNGCTGDYSCWCMQVTIPEPALEQVPTHQRGKACICRQCAEKYRTGDR